MPYSVNPSLSCCSLNSHHTVWVILYMCTCVTDRDLESGCLVWNGSRKRSDVTCQRSTIQMQRSDGFGLTGVGTSDVPAAADARWRQSKLRDKGILKAVLNIIDVIADKLLGTDVWNRQKSTGRWSRPLMEPERVVWSGANELQRQRNSDDSLSCRCR